MRAPRQTRARRRIAPARRGPGPRAQRVRRLGVPGELRDAERVAVTDAPPRARSRHPRRRRWAAATSSTSRPPRPRSTAAAPVPLPHGRTPPSPSRSGGSTARRRPPAGRRLRRPCAPRSPRPARRRWRRTSAATGPPSGSAGSRWCRSARRWSRPTPAPRGTAATWSRSAPRTSCCRCKGTMRKALAAPGALDRFGTCGTAPPARRASPGWPAPSRTAGGPSRRRAHRRRPLPRQGRRRPGRRRLQGRRPGAGRRRPEVHLELRVADPGRSGTPASGGGCAGCRRAEGWVSVSLGPE